MLVSIVTLTTPDRDTANIKEYIAAQTYPIHEHIIVEGAGSIGGKRNEGANHATGDIVIMCDDDDYFASDYVAKVVAHMRQTDCQITGLANAYFFKYPYLFEYKYGGRQPYVIGSGMAFRKEVMRLTQFPDSSNGEETGFLKLSIPTIPLPSPDSFVAIIHGGNTSSHNALRSMRRADLSIMQRIMGEHFVKYWIS